MTWLRRLAFALLLILGVGLLVSVVINIRQYRRLAAVEQQRDAVVRSWRQLQEALRQSGPSKTPAEAESGTPLGPNQDALAKRDAAIEQLNHQLSEAQANIVALQAQLVNSSEENEKALASASDRHKQEQENLQRQLDALKQQLDSAQAELQGSRDRIAALEADNAKLKTDISAASARAAEVAKVVAQLQELDSRRDALLTSLLRRYRDITSQFRAMSGMLGSSRDSNSASPFNDAALTNIQSTVTSAEDDLRQLNELNAQARQLEKKLVKK